MIPRSIKDTVDQNLGFNRYEMVSEIARRMGPKVPYHLVDDILKSFCDVASDALAEGKTVRLVNFMTIKPIIRPPRLVQTPTSDETIVDERLSVKFIPSGKLVDKIRGVKYGEVRSTDEEE